MQTGTFDLGGAMVEHKGLNEGEGEGEMPLGWS